MTKNLFRKLVSVLSEFLILVEEEQVEPNVKQTVIRIKKYKDAVESPKRKEDKN